MIDLNTLNKLEELKKAMIEEDKKNNDGNITKVEINIETKGNKDSNIFENKIYSKSIHSNFNSEVAMNSINNNVDYKNIKRGDVLYVDLNKNGVDAVGSEQSGIRYSICLQNNIGNKFSPTIIVALVTSKLTKSRIPTHVEIPAGNFGLPKDSIVMLEQIRTLDKKRIVKNVGTVDDITLLRIDRAKDISLGDLKPKSPLEKLPRSIQNEINKTIKKIYGCDDILEDSNNKDLISHLSKERKILLNHLERICSSYELRYEDYYLKQGKGENVIAI